MYQLNLLFLVPVTPSNLRTPRQQRLLEAFERHMERLPQGGWEVWILTDHNAVRGSIRWINCTALQKRQKIREITPLLRGRYTPRWVIRLDDDDFPTPALIHYLNRLSEGHGVLEQKSCHYYLNDKSAFEVVGTRPFSTVAHRLEHALASFRMGPDYMPLICGDPRIDWPGFYANKQLIFLPPSDAGFIRCALYPPRIGSIAHRPIQGQWGYNWPNELLALRDDLNTLSDDLRRTGNSHSYLLPKTGNQPKASIFGRRTKKV